MTTKIDTARADKSVRGLRLDKWLWFARFFKSRSLAVDAVVGGRVHVNGTRVKPAHEVQVGDVLAITRGDLRFDVVVQTLPVRRGPAPEAQAAYAETPQSVVAREAKQEQLRIAPPASTRRPSKHERRALLGLRGR